MTDFSTQSAAAYNISKTSTIPIQQCNDSETCIVTFNISNMHHLKIIISIVLYSY